MSRKHHLLLLTLFMALIFLLLTAAIKQPVIQHLDEQVLKWLMVYRNPAATIFFQGITFFGTSLFFFPATTIVVIILVMDRDWRGCAALLLTMNGAWALMEGLKAFYQRPRPTLGPLEQVPGFSFPSGHALMGTVFFGLLALMLLKKIFPRRQPLVIRGTVVFLLLLGLSRLYLGVHYPTDILAGYAAGVAVLALCRLWWP
ncbi:phosphatase PAP2 family protein [Moorella naiadis]|uniref:phosphatase PAP2 family protein n=1 Tax=Moorella naiadis (nom. illeg.) TaxID=3093670 RepID=UPI003D9C90A5